MTHKPSVLLISPDYFNYAQMLKTAFAEKGYEVDWFSDRQGGGFWHKALLRLNRRLVAGKIKKYLNGILSFCEGRTYDYVIVINAEAITPEFVQALRVQQPSARFVLYTWDSVANLEMPLKLAPYFDKCYSFDKTDCETYPEFEFLPLFYCDLESREKYERAPRAYDYVCIATIKPGKIRAIRQVCDELAAHYGRGYVYLFLQSRLVYLYYKLKYRKEFKGTKMSMFRYKRLSNRECDEISLQAGIVVDVSMRHQNGLTMRTFETLARGQRLLTSNGEIASYDICDPALVYIYDGEKPLDFSSPFFDENGTLPYNSAIKKYAVTEWIDHLTSIGVMQ